MQLSDEERRRRSEQARRLHAEGKLGGREFGKLGGRPKRKRASELLAEKVADHAQEIWDGLYRLTSDKSSAVQLKALLSLLEIEERERVVKDEEDRALEQMRRDELQAHVMEMLERMGAAGLLPETLDGEIVQGELESGGD